MSAFIGAARGPNHNSPYDAVEVWCSPGQVEVSVFDGAAGGARQGAVKTFDPIVARNIAALLVRASEEAERMSTRRSKESCDAAT